MYAVYIIAQLTDKPSLFSYRSCKGATQLEPKGCLLHLSFSLASPPWFFHNLRLPYWRPIQATHWEALEAPQVNYWLCCVFPWWLPACWGSHPPLPDVPLWHDLPPQRWKQSSGSACKTHACLCKVFIKVMVPPDPKHLLQVFSSTSYHIPRQTPN